MKHKVMIGTNNELYGLTEDMYEEGEKVTFSFYINSGRKPIDLQSMG